MSHPLPPGAVVGLLGGGQLARMTAHAAHRLGYKTHIFTPQRGSATQVSSRKTVAGYDDERALAAFAADVDVVTFEFENVPASTAAFLAERVRVLPGPHALATCQDRVAEKTFLRDVVGAPTTPWAPAASAAEVADVVRTLGPCVLKTARGGYDGKGQARIDRPEDADEAWQAVTGGRARVSTIVEAFARFDREGSIVLARAMDGTVAAYDLVENVHRHHILHQTLVPARTSADVAHAATTIATAIACALDYVGVMGVELFLRDDGAILVNELAPRPHNSGHWSLDAAVTSQFEQAVRAVTGHALGSTRRLANAEMTNLLGDDVFEVAALLREPEARLHLYGKTEVRPGRKMGHVTRLRPL